MKTSCPSRKVKRRFAVTKKAFKTDDVGDNDEIEEDLHNKGRNRATCHWLAQRSKMRRRVLTTSPSLSENSDLDTGSAMESQDQIVISNDDCTELTGQKASPSTKNQVVAPCAEDELPADNAQEASFSSKNAVLAQSADDEPPANAMSTEDKTMTTVVLHYNMKANQCETQQANAAPITSTMPSEMVEKANE
ncbi:hypothetical protein EI94DRAFT_1701685 [Lactarius quietus]|nr:hypothetical protein EI94DRAFT_1701685 [Lactarius quietus]